MARRTTASDTHTKDGRPKIRHRKGDGRFKAPPPKQSGPSIGEKPLTPADVEHDDGGGYRPGGVDPQT